MSFMPTGICQIIASKKTNPWFLKQLSRQDYIMDIIKNDMSNSLQIMLGFILHDQNVLVVFSSRVFWRYENEIHGIYVNWIWTKLFDGAYRCNILLISSVLCMLEGRCFRSILQAIMHVYLENYSITRFAPVHILLNKIFYC